MSAPPSTSTATQAAAASASSMPAASSVASSAASTAPTSGANTAPTSQGWTLVQGKRGGKSRGTSNRGGRPGKGGQRGGGPQPPPLVATVVAAPAAPSSAASAAPQPSPPSAPTGAAPPAQKAPADDKAKKSTTLLELVTSVSFLTDQAGMDTFAKIPYAKAAAEHAVVDKTALGCDHPCTALARFLSVKRVMMRSGARTHGKEKFAFADHVGRWKMFALASGRTQLSFEVHQPTVTNGTLLLIDRYSSLEDPNSPLTRAEVSVLLNQYSAVIWIGQRFLGPMGADWESGESCWKKTGGEVSYFADAKSKVAYRAWDLEWLDTQDLGTVQVDELSTCGPFSTYLCVRSSKAGQPGQSATPPVVEECFDPAAGLSWSERLWYRASHLPATLTGEVLVRKVLVYRPVANALSNYYRLTTGVMVDQVTVKVASALREVPGFLALMRHFQTEAEAMERGTIEFVMYRAKSEAATQLLGLRQVFDPILSRLAAARSPASPPPATGMVFNALAVGAVVALGLGWARWRYGVKVGVTFARGDFADAWRVLREVATGNKGYSQGAQDVWAYNVKETWLPMIRQCKPETWFDLVVMVATTMSLPVLLEETVRKLFPRFFRLLFGVEYTANLLIGGFAFATPAFLMHLVCDRLVSSFWWRLVIHLAFNTWVGMRDIHRLGLALSEVKGRGTAAGNAGLVIWMVATLVALVALRARRSAAKPLDIIQYVQESIRDGAFEERPSGFCPYPRPCIVPGHFSVRRPTKVARGECSVQHDEKVLKLTDAPSVSRAFEMCEAADYSKVYLGFESIVTTNGSLFPVAGGATNLLVALLTRTHNDPWAEIQSTHSQRRVFWKDAMQEMVNHGFFDFVVEAIPRDRLIAEQPTAAKRRALEHAFELLETGEYRNHAGTRKGTGLWVLSTHKVMVKADETCKVSAEGMKPRAIVVMEDTYKALLTEPSRAAAEQLKMHWNGRWAATVKPNIEVALVYAAGVPASKLDDFADLMVHSVRRNLVAMAGDDLIACVFIRVNGIQTKFFLESDFSAFDHTQGPECMSQDKVWLSRIGVDPNLTALYLVSTEIRYAVWCNGLRFAGEAGVQLPTGSNFTSVSNTIHNGAATLAALTACAGADYPTEGKFVSAMEAEYAKAGFIAKIKLHRELDEATFLKGWWLPTTDGVDRWVPLPSCVLKQGKTRTPLARIYPRLDEQERWKMQAAAFATMLGGVVSGYPIVSAFQTMWRRLGGGRSAEQAYDGDNSQLYKQRLDSDVRVDTAAAYEAIRKRYGIDKATIDDCEQLIATVDRPGFLTHPVFGLLQAVDYG